MPGTPIIVLTGGIASGKSTVARMLAEEGGEVISADVLAREVLAPGSPGWEEVVQTWGTGVLTPEGEIDRRRLGRWVFASSEERRRLEEITHPRIFALLQERLAAAVARAPFVVLEVPLYFETGRRLPASEVWVVYADRATQLARLVERSGLTPAEAEARLAAQQPLTEKCALADRVIDNSGTREQTRRAVQEALAALWGRRGPGEQGRSPKAVK
ncbi:MAG: dephospho-CoA kinase [Bacillota bacterium]|nr:dephospho-CoA kinase [Bacillota bacterium]